jgi:isoquinoline 1-oxidoreductase beta subunit
MVFNPKIAPGADDVAVGERRGPGFDMSRRRFLAVGSAAGGGMLLGFRLPGLGLRAEAAMQDAFAPNAFIRIAPDNAVTLIMPAVEMGQGTYTSVPMLLAEELEVGMEQVRVEPAPPNGKLYRNPILGEQATGGSTTIRGFFVPLRQAGATARVMLVTAAAQTWKVDAASCRAAAGTVTHVPTGRTLTYGALADRAATLPVPRNVALKSPQDFKLIGTSAKRLDTPAKTNGSAQFGIDAKIPGMKIATLAICPVFGGTLGAVDDSKAKAVNGVRQIVRLETAVAVVADHMGAARKGLAALVITWNPGVNATVSTADVISAMEAASKTQGVVATRQGDAAVAMAGATKKLEAVYQVPFLAHATMEPMNCTVHVRKDGCDVWVGTQVPVRAQIAAAQATGLRQDQVQVHNHLLGGGFGRRLDVDTISLAVQIGRQVDGPVKVIWTREEDTQHDVYRPYYYDVLAAGLDGNGMPVAFTHRVVGASILARWLPPAFVNGLDADAVEGAFGPYDFPNVLIDYVRHEPPPGMLIGWWRGVGITHNAFMVEGFTDELAAMAGKDPVDYRRTLLAKAPRALAVLNLAAEKAGWGQKMPAGTGRGISIINGFGSYVAQVAEVSVDKDGTVAIKRVVCAVDCGQKVNPNTIAAQMEGGIIFGITAALYGNITLKDGRVEQANFDTYQMLRINQAPKIETYLIDSAEAPGGIGEPGTAAIAPAVVNAIYAATGKRLRQLPVDTTQLKSA